MSNALLREMHVNQQRRINAEWAAIERRCQNDPAYRAEYMEYMRAKEKPRAPRPPPPPPPVPNLNTAELLDLSLELMGTDKVARIDGSQYRYTALEMFALTICADIEGTVAARDRKHPMWAVLMRQLAVEMPTIPTPGDDTNQDETEPQRPSSLSETMRMIRLSTKEYLENTPPGLRYVDHTTFSQAFYGHLHSQSWIDAHWGTCPNYEVDGVSYHPWFDGATVMCVAVNRLTNWMNPVDIPVRSVLNVDLPVESNTFRYFKRLIKTPQTRAFIFKHKPFHANWELYGAVLNPRYILHVPVFMERTRNYERVLLTREQYFEMGIQCMPNDASPEIVPGLRRCLELCQKYPKKRLIDVDANLKKKVQDATKVRKGDTFPEITPADLLEFPITEEDEDYEPSEKYLSQDLRTELCSCAIM